MALALCQYAKRWIKAGVGDSVATPGAQPHHSRCGAAAQAG